MKKQKSVKLSINDKLYDEIMAAGGENFATALGYFCKQLLLEGLEYRKNKELLFQALQALQSAQKSQFDALSELFKLSKSEVANGNICTKPFFGSPFFPKPENSK